LSVEFSLTYLALGFNYEPFDLQGLTFLIGRPTTLLMEGLENIMIVGFITLLIAWLGSF